jgi:hypothetical protein
MPAPALFPSLFCPAAPADSTQPISLAFALDAHPELPERRRRFASTPASHWPSWAAHPSPPRTTTTPWGASPHPTDTPRPLLTAGPQPEPPHRHYLLAGELLFPSNLSLRPFSVQSNHPSGFLSSCCSYWTRTWPPSSPGNPLLTSPHGNPTSGRPFPFPRQPEGAP